MTNIPRPVLTDTGFEAPAELDVLAGVQTDWDDAFQRKFNFGTPTNPTPQGQLATSTTAAIGALHDLFCLLANSNDPALASGRYQDAIARIYFLSRNPGQPTVAQCECTGRVNTQIPFGWPIENADGLRYFALAPATIPAGGSVTVAFACSLTGPTPCEANTLNIISRSIAGWDKVTNPAAGVPGAIVEQRGPFEERRRLSVAQNSRSQNSALLGALRANPAILDAYVRDNGNNYAISVDPEATAVASISGTTLSIVQVLTGTIKTGQPVLGTDGTGIGVAAGTLVIAGSGMSWTVNASQTVVETTLSFGGVSLGPHELYVAEIGGNLDDVAHTIWSKKSPGAVYYAGGNTTRTTYDTSDPYPAPGIPYVVKWEIPPDLDFVFRVTLIANSAIPANGPALIQDAILKAFAGAMKGTPRATIGSKVIGALFVPPIVALGAWAQVAYVKMGTVNHTTADAIGSMGAAATGASSGTTDITLSSVVGYVSPGDAVAGDGIPSNATVASQTSGTTGSDGVYVLNVPTAVAGPVTVTSPKLVVTTLADGVIAAGQYLLDDTFAVQRGTRIVSQNSGSTGGVGIYTASVAQRVASQTMRFVVPDQDIVDVRINQMPVTIAPIIEVDLL